MRARSPRPPLVSVIRTFRTYRRVIVPSIFCLILVIMALSVGHLHVTPTPASPHEKALSQAEKMVIIRVPLRYKREPPTRSTAVCPAGPPAYALTTEGNRCVFPFRTNTRPLTSNCDGGYCATEVNVFGHARRLSQCSKYDGQATLSAQDLLNVTQCDGDLARDVSARDAAVDVVLGNSTFSGFCGCGEGILKYVSCHARPTTCRAVCSVLNIDSTSASHAKQQQGSPDLLQKLAELAQEHAPSSYRDLERWKTFVESLPSSDEVHQHWCGRGIAIMAGSVTTLPQALATVSFLRGHFKSTVPVEIWRTADEASEFPEGMQQSIDQLGVMIRTLPPEAKSSTTNEMFALKPAVVLASSFDTVLLLDADALPLVDPSEIFALRHENVSAVFWPDYWTLLHDAKIWSAVGGWPFPTETAPSQDSGVMVVCKNCGGWKPLALAFYFNYHSTVYYPAIYFGHWSERRCHANSCVRGHDIPGIGDKDTFQVGFFALKEPMTMMPPAAIAGTLLPKRRLTCGSSFVHLSPDRRPVALHHNSNKWWWHDFVSGKWVSWHAGFMLARVTTFANESNAYFADGMNDWRSVTYSNRGDGGRQMPPAGSRWCIIYKGETNTVPGRTFFGWNVEAVLTEYYTRLYSSPWMVEWATISDTVLPKCLLKLNYTEEYVAASVPDDMRNAVISFLSDHGYGTVSQLQEQSDGALGQTCDTYFRTRQITSTTPNTNGPA
ncbi:hypothetical protein DIPPA_17992 [Diplonema papillatum]|nr:hypothetical protein DIPPA_17992 [Diplonema papillatum]